MEIPDNEAIADAVLALVSQRGAGSSACPSEVARLLAPDQWRALMPQVREVAARLAVQGRIEMTQRGAVVSPEGPWKGPIRLRQPPDDLPQETSQPRPPKMAVPTRTMVLPA